MLSPGAGDTPVKGIEGTLERGQRCPQDRGGGHRRGLYTPGGGCWRCHLHPQKCSGESADATWVPWWGPLVMSRDVPRCPYLFLGGTPWCPLAMSLPVPWCPSVSLPVPHPVPLSPPQETDQLEEEKAELESEIAELQKEKERLEFVLVAHAPACKLPFEDAAPLGAGPPEVSTLGKEEPPGPVAFPFQPGPQGPFPSCCFAPGAPPPVPPNPSYTSSFVFTYPEGATCGASHQRSSSSDQSSDSLNSPSLLAL